MENESRQKKAAVETEEDPYGGSTDENTDAEAEQDHPIPELPGMSVISKSSFTPMYMLPSTALLLFPLCHVLQTS